MKKSLSPLLLILLPFLSACELKNNPPTPKTQLRTMIIGGMPVHEHDYRLALQLADDNTVSR